MRMHSWKSVASFALLAVTFLLAEFSPAGGQTTKAQASKAQDAKKANTQDPDKQGRDTLTPRGAQRAKITQHDKDTFEKETRSAIIVAPSYRDSGLAMLRYTFADAVELKAELERQGYTVRMIPSSEATADSIRQALVNQKTFLDGTTQATLIFAFMGHGFQDSNGQNYLMTYGADLNNMDKEALSLDEIQKLINASGARRKVILIDACRNVPGTRDAEKPRTMAEFKAAEGTAILLATKPGAYSYEDSELSHGVFTYFLLEGLRGKAAGMDGFVTFRDMSDYVERSVLAYSMKKDQAQKPLATLHDVGGDFLLATAAPPKPGELKPVTAASEITSDATVMRALATNRSFFAALNEGSLTLIDASTGQPFAILSEHTDQLKDKAETSKRSLRWFAGNGPDNSAVHMVAEMRGQAMLQLWGRIGKPCPNDQPCSTSPYPLLPGEVRGATSEAIDKTKKGAGALIAGAGRVIGRRTNETAQIVVSSSTAIERSGLSVDSRVKFIWTKFDLTSTAKPPNQGTNQTQR
jgi:hypothetical protein